MRTAKSCGPGTRCWCQVGGGKSARPGADKAISADDGGKRNSRTGESTKETVKTIACGNAGCSGGPVVATLVCFLPLHTRLRVQRAPGIPHALLGRRMPAQLGRIAPRDRGFAFE